MEDKLSIKLNIANRIYPMKIERSSEENIRNAIKKIETRLKFYEENYAIKDKQDLVAMCLIEYASKLEYFNNKDIETDLTTRLEGINNILNDNILNDNI